MKNVYLRYMITYPIEWELMIRTFDFDEIQFSKLSAKKELKYLATSS